MNRGPTRLGRPPGGEETNLEEDVRVQVPGGPSLEGRLALGAGARGGLVVCHPHPLYGGDMDNPVVARVTEVAQEVGLCTLRFNFRGAARSAGTHAGGEGEQDDVKAALETLRSVLPPGRPCGLAGYSFGAWVASRVAGPAFPVAGLGLIAPPLTMFDWRRVDRSGTDILLVAGTLDPYCPQHALAAGLPGVQAVSIEGADHFFVGAALHLLGEAVRGWVRRWTAG